MKHHRRGEHEPDTTSVGGVVVAAIALIVFVAVTIMGIRGFEGVLRVERETAPAQGERLESGPHAARLTYWEDPAADLAKLREQENERLSGYDWIDRDNGIVRIPIERAMELIVARSPATAEQPSITPNGQASWE